MAPAGGQAVLEISFRAEYQMIIRKSFILNRPGVEEFMTWKRRVLLSAVRLSPDAECHSDAFHALGAFN